MLVIFPMIEAHGPHQDLTKPGCDRTHLRIDAIGQALRDALQPFANLLASKVDVGGFVEDSSDLGKAVTAQRAGVFKAGNAGKGRFDRKRHLLLDQFGRECGRTDVDLNLIVRDVRHRVDREPVEGPATDNGGDGGEEQDEPALLDRPCDDASDHDINPRAPLRPCRVRP